MPARSTDVVHYWGSDSRPGATRQFATAGDGAHSRLRPRGERSNHDSDPLRRRPATLLESRSLTTDRCDAGARADHRNGRPRPARGYGLAAGRDSRASRGVGTATLSRGPGGILSHLPGGGCRGSSSRRTALESSASGSSRPSAPASRAGQSRDGRVKPESGRAFRNGLGPAVRVTQYLSGCEARS